MSTIHPHLADICLFMSLGLWTSDQKVCGRSSTTHARKTLPRGRFCFYFVSMLYEILMEESYLVATRINNFDAIIYVVVEGTFSMVLNLSAANILTSTFVWILLHNEVARGWWRMHKMIPHTMCTTIMGKGPKQSQCTGREYSHLKQIMTNGHGVVFEARVLNSTIDLWVGDALHWLKWIFISLTLAPLLDWSWLWCALVFHKRSPPLLSSDNHRLRKNYFLCMGPMLHGPQ